MGCAEIPAGKWSTTRGQPEVSPTLKTDLTLWWSHKRCLGLLGDIIVVMWRPRLSGVKSAACPCDLVTQPEARRV